MKQVRSAPLLRWVGGKARYARWLAELLGPVDKSATYYEPFAGALSCFFRRRPANAILSDLNPNLMQFYFALRDETDDLLQEFAKLPRVISTEIYYKIRAEYNDNRNGAKGAAYFLFLNRACFNGIWRVNRSGQFNTPMGSRAEPILPTSDNIAECAQALRSAQLRERDFEEAVCCARSGDIVYLDPPYPPLSRTSFFVHYTAGRFTLSDHQRLASVFGTLSERGVKVLLTVGDTPEIRKMYAPYTAIAWVIPRPVNGSSRRVSAKELIIFSHSADLGQGSIETHFSLNAIEIAPRTSDKEPVSGLCDI
jgi:DNA adenine methylase